MKLFIFAILATLSLSSLANHKWDLERNLKLLARQVDALSQQNADLLTVNELKTSIRKLKDLKATLLGLGSGYPTPVCSLESPEALKRAFSSLKHFAYSIKGPELSEEQAIQYAIDWTNTYPCSYVDTFERNYFTIKRYASVSNGGLDMSDEDSIKYANEKTPLFCGDQNFKQDFWAAYKLARYEMNLPEAQAVNYAKRIVERDHFTCRWDDNIILNNVDLNASSFDLSNICITPVIVPGMPVITPNVPSTPRAPRSPRY